MPVVLARLVDTSVLALGLFKLRGSAADDVDDGPVVVVSVLVFAAPVGPSDEARSDTICNHTYILLTQL